MHHKGFAGFTNQLRSYFSGPVPHLKVKIAEVLSDHRWKRYSSFRQKVPLMFKGKCKLSQTKPAEWQCNEMEIIFEGAQIMCWLDCRFSLDLQGDMHMEMLFIFYDVTCDFDQIFYYFGKIGLSPNDLILQWNLWTVFFMLNVLFVRTSH